MEKRPNIIVIMTDDHAAHAMSCYGSVINQTPHMDRIADKGILFENCFCTNSICAPSRAVILTGKHSHKNGVLTLADDIDASQQTFISLLKQSGYNTGIIGKWHLGMEKDSLPKHFDHYSIFPGQGEYFNPRMNVNGTFTQFEGYATDLVTDQSLEWINSLDDDNPFCLLCYHKAPHRPWEPDKKHMHMYEDLDIPLPTNFHDDYSNRSQAAKNAKMRIADHMNSNDLKIIPPKDIIDTGTRIPVADKKSDNIKIDYNRILLSIPDAIEGYQLTKRDGTVVTFETKKELIEWKYQQYIKDYLRCVASVDDNIGRLLDYIEENDMANDTIIIYTSDQGFFLGDHGWFDKRFMYEESLRMPLLMKYPAKVPPNSLSKEIVSNLDFAETLLDFAGVQIPEDMQGKSFREIAEGTFDGVFREGVYYRYFMHLAHHGVPAHYGVRTSRYKLIYYYGEPLGTSDSINNPTEPEWELFDLEKDPHEMINLYNNTQYIKVQKELTELLYRLKEEAEDNL